MRTKEEKIHQKELHKEQILSCSEKKRRQAFLSCLISAKQLQIWSPPCSIALFSSPLFSSPLFSSPPSSLLFSSLLLFSSPLFSSPLFSSPPSSLLFSSLLLFSSPLFSSPLFSSLSL